MEHSYLLRKKRQNNHIYKSINRIIIYQPIFILTLGGLNTPSLIMKSLRKQVFEYKDSNPQSSVRETIKHFGEYNSRTIRSYYDSYKPNPNDISNDIFIINFDTVKEAEIAYQKNNYKGVAALHQIHQMKLRPVKNLEKRTLKEMLDG